MGTRADFYVGRGSDAEWLGSIAWDGYPKAIDRSVLRSTDAAAFRAALTKFFDQRDDVTLPEQGWPWPWEDSQTTDYAYAFDDGRVWASAFGYRWWEARKKEPEHKDGSDKQTTFPNMTSRQKVTLGKRSGVLIVGPGGPVEDLP